MSEVGEMTQSEAFRICPNCGSEEVPKLIMRSAHMSVNDSCWRCRVCNFDWSDADDFQPFAS